MATIDRDELSQMIKSYRELHGSDAEAADLMSNENDLDWTLSWEMRNDSQNCSDALLDLYESADANGRDTIDQTLIAISGWSFPTLLQMAVERTLG